MSKLIFKKLQWHNTDYEVYEMSNVPDCAAYVRPDHKGGFRGVFDYIFKDGFKTQEDAMEWVEKRFKESIEWHVEGASNNKIIDAIREELDDIKHKCEFENYDEEKANIEIQFIKKIINKIKDL